MNFSIQRKESHTVIKVNNISLDALVAPELKSELYVMVKDGERNILLDLSSCQDCDSSGMSAMLLGSRLCAEVHGNFILCGISLRIREMIDLAEISNYLLVTDTPEEAVTHFA